MPFAEMFMTPVLHGSPRVRGVARSVVAAAAAREFLPGVHLCVVVVSPTESRLPTIPNPV